ncbi:MAG TPA: PH domain-containing protein [Symbiobacteriaceae bacterium]|nr:PH domain-containing protein [Symbiobacteriaceae bacterium]
MLKKLAADALGLSDIGTVISPSDYDKVDADDYIMHEDGEKIFFLIKSRSDEYCFTNLALIHVDGTSAVSKKRTLRRFNYSTNRVAHVSLETAGTVDLDVEIKFTLGDVGYSIDVHKKHLEQVKDLYKALLAIAQITHENDHALRFSQQSLETATAAMGRVSTRDDIPSDQFARINEYAFNWLVTAREKYHVKDFGHVFKRYLEN